MTYFKIIENNEAVDAGWMWLRWDTRHNCLMACEPREAHYAQNYKENAVYRFGWLNPLPDGAPMYPAAEAAIIDAEEYNDLIEILDDGETVPEPVEPDPGGDEPEPKPEPEPQPERPMSIAEMRAAIAQMQAELNGVDMTAHENYPKDFFFSIGIRLFQALEPIVAGEQIEPGKNCKEISAAETLNKLNESEE